jgi:hypothetical protein
MIETDKNGARDKTNEVYSGWRQVNNKKIKISSARGNKMQGTKTNESEGEGGMTS